MANILYKTTIGTVWNIVVDSDPSLSSGTVAPIGSRATDTSGVQYYKNSATDTDWKQIASDSVVTNRQTASYILALTDRNKIVEMNVGTANDLTVPPNTDVAFPVGTQILISQYGAGQTSVVAGSGVTIRSASSALKLTTQYACASLIKIGTNEWYLFGNITT